MEKAVRESKQSSRRVRFQRRVTFTQLLLRAPKLGSLERQRVFQAHAALFKQLPLPDKRLDELFHRTALLEDSGAIWHGILSLRRRKISACFADVVCSLQ